MLKTGGGVGPVTDMRGVLAQLVSQRDRINAAIGGIRILLGDDEAPEAEVVAERKALPAPKRRRRARTVKASAKKPKARATREAKTPGTRRGIAPETIARIQELDGQGKPRYEIARLCGVSAPTVAKYADAPAVRSVAKPADPPKTNGAVPTMAAPAKDSRTGRVWI